MHECKHEGKLASLESRVINLEGWQKIQNGSILRVEAKIDKLIFWVMTAFGGFILTLIATVILQVVKG